MRFVCVPNANASDRTLLNLRFGEGGADSGTEDSKDLIVYDDEN